jgi:bacteriochlorophyll 4-vinyl reductase
MRWLLPRLPTPLASRVLLAAVSRQSWTFAGSGVFRAEPGRPVRLSLTGCPICRRRARLRLRTALVNQGRRRKLR